MLAVTQGNQRERKVYQVRIRVQTAIAKSKGQHQEAGADVKIPRKCRQDSVSDIVADFKIGLVHAQNLNIDRIEPKPEIGTEIILRKQCLST